MCQAVTNGTAAPAAEALRHFLVSNGGETGGWDARDHGLFLQWRSRFRNNRQTFVSAVCDTVPVQGGANGIFSGFSHDVRPPQHDGWHPAAAIFFFFLRVALKATILSYRCRKRSAERREFSFKFCAFLDLAVTISKRQQ
ncbi:hypothetical protein OUZ56_015196 [Daphnia magna]|uniref:Uncharacterized protein n=1 Tax=Daphnia magna TaxID=35525 RepID=A0ABR0AM40_9CRUS|nr:hypothetical protein OUZ56_015196 [Daphnia magna]